MTRTRAERKILLSSSLLVLATFFGISAYLVRVSYGVIDSDTTLRIMNIIRYVIPGIGGAIILLLPKKTVRRTIIISGFTLAAFCFFDVYVNLIFYKALNEDTKLADFVLGFVELVVGVALTANIVIFSMNPKAELNAAKFSYLGIILFGLFQLIFYIRHGEKAQSVVASVAFLIPIFISMGILMSLLSEDEVKHTKVMTNLKNSISRIRDGLGTNAGITIDRDDLRHLIKMYSEGMDSDRKDMILRTYYENNFRLILYRLENGIQMVIVSSKSKSLLDGFSMIIGDIQTEDDIDTCDTVRIYGRDHRFIQLIVNDFDEKTKQRLAKEL